MNTQPGLACSQKDILFPDDEDEFRVIVREWLTAHYTLFKVQWGDQADPRSLVFRRGWEDHLCSNGMAGLGWPEQYGGHALDLRRQAVFHEEHALCGAPLGINLIGHGILAPTLLHFGTEAQKRSHLPGILSNQVIWCQGYSEPGAGSDLAALRTRAEATATGYRLNGHKIWTSFADQADWCFVLARTDLNAPRHRGLSFMLVNMRQPGVRVSPIRQLTGEAEFCEVFFENAEVRREDLVGEENQGWKIAMAAASYERGTYFIPRLVRFHQELMQIRQWIADRQQPGEHAQTSSLVRRWSRLAVDSHVLALKSRRALASAVSGEPPGPLGSSTKVHWSEAHQTLLALALELLGSRACLSASFADDEEAALFTHAFLWSKAETILAGTSEIQRNIIAEKVLGLPKGA